MKRRYIRSEMEEDYRLAISEQRRAFAILPILFLAPWHVLEFAFVDLVDRPGPRLLGVFEEPLIFLKGAPACFGGI